MADLDRGIAYLNRASAKPHLIAPMDIMDRVMALYDGGRKPGDSTGWPSLDRYFTVTPGRLTVVTGWPSSGKSEWLDAMLIHLSRQGWYSAVFSPEKLPVEDHSAQMAEKLCGKPFGIGPNERMNRDEVRTAHQHIDKYFRFMDAPEEATLSPRSIIETATEWLLSKPKRILVMDPWNELEHQRPQNLSETEYVSQTLSYIRRWSKPNAVHTFIVAHPQKMRLADGTLPIPRPDMISGSQNWWNKPDANITVYRDQSKDTNEVQIHIQKCRGKHIGRQGMAMVLWDKVTGRYFEPSANDYRGRT